MNFIKKEYNFSPNIIKNTQINNENKNNLTNSHSFSHYQNLKNKNFINNYKYLYLPFQKKINSNTQRKNYNRNNYNKNLKSSFLSDFFIKKKEEKLTQSFINKAQKIYLNIQNKKVDIKYINKDFKKFQENNINKSKKKILIQNDNKIKSIKTHITNNELNIEKNNYNDINILTKINNNPSEYDKLFHKYNSNNYDNSIHIKKINNNINKRQNSEKKITKSNNKIGNEKISNNNIFNINNNYYPKIFINNQSKKKEINKITIKNIDEKNSYSTTEPNIINNSNMNSENNINNKIKSINVIKPLPINNNIIYQKKNQIYKNNFISNQKDNNQNNYRKLLSEQKNNSNEYINNKNNDYKNIALFTKNSIDDGYTITDNNTIISTGTIHENLPVVADENISNINPKIMKYNKQIYSNNYLSDHFQNLFILDNNKRDKFLFYDIFFSFLTGNDLYNFSLINTFLYKVVISKIYEIICRKVLKNNEKLREKIWKSIAYKTNLSNKVKLRNVFQEAVKKKSKYSSDIIKDLTRTFPKDNYFKQNSNGYNMLFDILNAYAIYNPKIGYTQGMNFIVGKLIKFFKEEKSSFLYLDAIIKRLNFESFIGINNVLSEKMEILIDLLLEYSPEISNYLLNKKINHEIFTFNWIITLFSKNSKDDDTIYIIWDYIFIFGWKFIYFFIISILNKLKNNIIKLDIYEFTQYMKNLFFKEEFNNKFQDIIFDTFKFLSKSKIININNLKKISEKRLKSERIYQKFKSDE